jgi:hypothetical protein
MNLRQNIDTLEQLITNVEHTSDRKFTNKERNQLITITFADDTRPGHSAIFVATGDSVDDYYERIAKIIQHTDDLASTHYECQLLQGNRQNRCCRCGRISREVSRLHQVR